MKIDYDSVVIGAGPAGITASIYLKRSNINCLLIEKNIPGGQIAKSSTISNYPGFTEISGPDLATKLYEQTKLLNIPYKALEVKEINKYNDYFSIKTEKEEITTKTIILAVGKEPKTMHAKNSKSLVGKGISFCSLCDGYLYKNEDVAIVGGGNSALEESLYLSEICKSVTIINRSENLRGDDILVEKIKNKSNINILYNSEVSSFVEQDDKLNLIKVQVKDKKIDLKVKACFIFIGYKPATEFLENLDILDSNGYISVDEKCETKINGIFAAGDVIKKEAYQIVTAAGDGAIAAISCIKYLD